MKTLRIILTVVLGLVCMATHVQAQNPVDKTKVTITDLQITAGNVVIVKAEIYMDPADKDIDATQQDGASFWFTDPNNKTILAVMSKTEPLKPGTKAHFEFSTLALIKGATWTAYARLDDRNSSNAPKTLTDPRPFTIK